MQNISHVQAKQSMYAESCQNMQVHYICKNRPSDTCRYTRLTDKNNQKIWEGDICKIGSRYIDEEDGLFVVRWDDSGARFVLAGDSLVLDFYNVYGTDCEVVGNIFDNPELIEGEDDDRE